MALKAMCRGVGQCDFFLIETRSAMLYLIGRLAVESSSPGFHRSRQDGLKSGL